ncbi:hypothetical protein GCM10023321_44880 [Pseudonocardia eucalypti]|uniref:ABC transmembrane type-1 domain-containing protein n=1 Tax=Pseudonocardia eucalypti TaxID=648755 RepID=A0ABP9QFS4_9PSEU
MAAARVRGLFGPGAGLLEVIGVLVIIGAGVWQLSAGRITLGGLLVFLVYLSQLYGPVRGLGVLTGQVGQSGDGWVASCGGVGSVMVVLVDPAG